MNTSTGMGFYLVIMPIILTSLGVFLVIALRWFSYRERMAMITRDIPLEEASKEEKRKTFLASGIIVGLIGLAISLALFTIGTGPWLLYGLLPFFVGLALILAGLVMGDSKRKEEEPQQAGDTWESIQVSQAASSEVVWDGQQEEVEEHSDEGEDEPF